MAASTEPERASKKRMSPAKGWPSGSDESAELIRRIDWSRTALGPKQQWPPALRSLLATLLGSALPMMILWGPRLIQLYNDRCRALLGHGHPGAMGVAVADFWPDDWPAIERVCRRVIDNGETVQIDAPLLHWRGDPAALCCSPVRDADGAVQGVLVTGAEPAPKPRAQLDAQLVARHRIALGQLSKLFEQAPGFAAVLRGPDHLFEMANEAFYQLVGRRELLGRPLLQALPELDEMGFRELLDRVLATGRPFVGRSMRTALRITPDAAPTESWIDFVFQPLVEDDGTISGVFVQGHDVSERKLAEVALRERNQRLAVLYDTARAMLAAEQPMDFLDRIYGRLADLLGLDVYLHHGCADDGSHLRLTAHRGLSAEHADRLARCDLGEAVCGRVAKTREPIVSDDVQASSDRLLDPIRALGVRAFVCEPLIARGQVVGTLSLGSTFRCQLDDNALGTIRAISQLVAVAIERQRTRNALRDSEERFRSVFSHATVGIAVTDDELRILHANDAFCRLVGVGEDGLRDNDLVSITHPEDRERYLHALRQVLGGEVPSVLVQTRLRRAAGGVFWVQASVAAIRDDEGRPSSLISLVEDIDERKRAESQLARVDRTRNEFLAMLAHELRNPMAPLRNAIALMERGRGAAEYSSALVSIMRRQIDQLSRLVGDLLEVSRIDQGRIELRIAPMSLEEAIGSAVEAVQPLADERGQKLEVAPLDDIGWIDGDSCRIAQVVTNLLHNAVKFTPEGGRIELRVDQRQPDAVEIEVCDEGVGIAADLLPHVFNLFEQGQQTLDRSQGGLGIGLALVRDLVRMHGGQVSASSDGPGRGASFVVRLPRRWAGNGGAPAASPADGMQSPVDGPGHPRPAADGDAGRAALPH
jgi:PAS domain S-box-containing protein